MIDYVEIYSKTYEALFEESRRQKTFCTMDEVYLISGIFTEFCELGASNAEINRASTIGLKIAANYITPCSEDINLSSLPLKLLDLWIRHIILLDSDDPKILEQEYENAAQYLQLFRSEDEEVEG